MDNQTNLYVEAVVGWKRILITSFCIGIFMVKFGMLFIFGSNWHQSSQGVFMTTLFNFDHWVASQKPFPFLST